MTCVETDIKLFFFFLRFVFSLVIYQCFLQDILFFKLGYGQLFVGMSPVTLLLFQSQNNSEGLSGLVCREEKLSKLSDVSKENVKQEGKYILTNILADV